jgi:site-specific DNA-cytosine methylase
MQGGDRQPKIVENKFTKNKNVDLNVYREMVVKNNYDLPIAVDEQNVTVRKDFTVATLTTDGSSPKKNNRIMETDFRIRKLTPLECWRLMGFDDADFYKAQKSGISNSQLYKQAGNSIVVNVLEKIFKNLF